MKRAVIVMLLAISAVLLIACGSEEKPSMEIVVNNEIVDQALNNIQDDTEPIIEKHAQTEQADKENTTDMIGVFTADNNDIYQFNSDKTYSCLLVESGETLYGTYDTNNKTYITLKREGEDDITYQLTKTDTADEDGNTVKVIVLTKGKIEIILQKQFES